MTEASKIAREPGEPSPRRTRGPSPAKTAETRRAILSAALDAFLAEGFSGARMSDVASRAGLAKGTLYLHFPDKEALFEGVVAGAIGDPLKGAMAAPPGPDEPTRAYLLRNLGPLFADLEGSRRGAVIRLVATEGPRFPGLSAIYRRRVIDPAIEAVRRLAARALARGEIRSDALVRIPQLLIAPALMATLWNGLYGAEEPLDAGAAFAGFLDLVLGPAPDGDASAG
ncbi:TetR/AcrR family transcriptional regulator [Methylobacterium nonmethylotrophicum]|uniref:TetR/AcrR family transcriptional regulator n=1 Tax=Methylobacterium nonmethylotrophicum TaxID=1141884 RepID=A0A4Z0ND52_9HYPH|nr:TetR/AcrR family transcriptional regulator [Methylobacterium nonmethylotrophicum]TGD93273.1 TetR/AcrR family transcriptional regulator [Methylobacterium nonmethylotrophicum]